MIHLETSDSLENQVCELSADEILGVSGAANQPQSMAAPPTDWPEIDNVPP